jgi:predicted HTH transcriptional regulator
MGRAEDLFERLERGGETEVLSFISQPVTEELFLDYKRSGDNGAGTSLDNNDRRNLAKAISGFGNSEGGVIVWGVDCRNDKMAGDIPISPPIRIQNPTRFKSLLEQATSGLTVPPHATVRHHSIAEGFVVTLIPSGLHAPYQTVGDLSYYIRAGSNFARAPHAVLAGMFGRRPQPIIKPCLSGCLTKI